MSKAKRKKPMQEPADLDFTERRRQAMGFGPERTHVMGGERRVTLHTIRRRSPALGWSFLTRSEQAALIRYAELAEAVDVTVKSCLAPQSGGDRDEGAERRVARKQNLDAATRACTGPALAFTRQALIGDAPPLLDVLAHVSFGSPREAARITARAMVGITARELVRHFGA
jgi:hypothetical protein